jgi:hypothetical protein
MIAAALMALPAPGRAQNAPWADSTARPSEAAIYRTWLAYVASKPQGITDCYTASRFWLASEQTGGCYDLANSFLMPRTVPRVISIDPADSSGREYRVVLEARHADPSAPSPTWWTAMRITIYAVRDGARWVFSGALSRTTATWRRETVGPITYIVQPGHGFDLARARRAVTWSDSVAGVFGVPPLPPLQYFLTLSTDDVYRIMGLESDVKYGPGGGNAKPGMIFSGTPSVGEAYQHELMHVLMAPLTTGRTTYLTSEGVATWLGGTQGLDFSTAVARLARYLDEHPTVTLDSIIDRELKSFTTTEIYPTGALLAAMAYEAGGIGAVKEFLGGGPTRADLRQTLVRVLRQPWPQIVVAWRSKAAKYSPRPAG